MDLDAARAANLANWEDRVVVHSGPGGYDLAAFDDDPDHLDTVVRFDQPRLGDLGGLDVVHLQCHLGNETVSLARLGARVTGYDFSPAALAVARELARRSGADATFVEGELHDAVVRLGGERFDLVYTGIGALCWLPEAAAWARVVAGLLRPGGRLHLREGHPMLWALADPRPDGLLVVEHPYVEADEPLECQEATSYSGRGTLAHPVTYQWNHGLAEVVNGLWAAGLELTAFEEHHSAPWNPLGEAMAPTGPFGEYELTERPERLAATYTIQARKPAGPVGLSRRP